MAAVWKDAPCSKRGIVGRAHGFYRLTLALALLSGCDERPEKPWEAYVYPDISDLTKFDVIDRFATFEQCQAAAIAWLRSLPNPARGDYECGYMCAPRAEYGGVNICKETRK